MRAWPRRYARAGPLYDRLAAEWVYAPGRAAAVDLLRLRPGGQVLDVGCGTGLNLAALLARVGPQGRVVGVDASASMLDQARRRTDRHGWANVTLVQADATAVPAGELSALLSPGGADAVLSTYALSIMRPWRRAWDTARQVARPGARMGVVDMQLPSGRARALGPVARLACALGGADPDARPWTAVEQDCVDVSACSLRGGHIEVRVGTLAE